IEQRTQTERANAHPAIAKEMPARDRAQIFRMQIHSSGHRIARQRFGVRQSSGAFSRPRASKRQRTGALQNAGAPVGHFFETVSSRFKRTLPTTVHAANST